MTTFRIPQSAFRKIPAPLACHLAEGTEADVLSANIGIHFTELGGRPTIVFSGDLSSTRQHSVRGTTLKKKKLLHSI